MRKWKKKDDKREGESSPKKMRTKWKTSLFSPSYMTSLVLDPLIECQLSEYLLMEGKSPSDKLIEYTD